MNMDLILLQADQNQLFGTSFFDMEGILHLVIRFSFNLLVVGIIVRGLYYTLTRKKNYLFSFMLIGVVVFLICYLLESLGLTMISKEQLEKIIEKMIKENRSLIEERGQGALGPLMGKIMKKGRGRVKAELLSETLRRKLEDYTQ